MTKLYLSATKWRKSSHSSGQGGDCVEVTAALWHKSSHSVGEGECVEVASWRKSSHSSSQGGECVEVADLSPVIAVRDSKDPDGPKLAFPAADWHAFTRRIKASDHERA